FIQSCPSSRMKALEDRNLTAHTYREDVAQTVEKRIRENYYFLIEALYEVLKEKKIKAENESN
ncbi:MAG: nucleotidyltransferase substrate binding protein, partial [Bacteroidota bacterium]